jgi:DNA-binding MarR family transcriptional regulator
MIDRKINDEQLREAIELLYFGYRSFTEGPDRILAKRGLNRMHHRILYFVGRNPGGSVSDLLDVLQITKQALHMPLRQLLSMQLIISTKAKHDARVRELRLSSDGRRLEARLTGTQMNQLAEIFDRQGMKALQSWCRVMQQLADD